VYDTRNYLQIRVRFRNDILNEIDAWRGNQDNPPMRSVAIVQLVREGLWSKRPTPQADEPLAGRYQTLARTLESALGMATRESLLAMSRSLSDAREVLEWAASVDDMDSGLLLDCAEAHEKAVRSLHEARRHLMLIPARPENAKPGSAL
jgi:hypothetical protein